MHTSTLLFLAAILGGLFITSQGPINARASQALGGPLQGAFISFTGGWLFLLILNIIQRPNLPSWHSLADHPWWIWIGGFLGAYMVTVAAIATPRIGVAAWVAGVMVGQLVSSMVLDHYGAFGMEPKPITITKIFGVILLGAGAVLIRRG